jgi:hypothetical protein
MGHQLRCPQWLAVSGDRSARDERNGELLDDVDVDEHMRERFRYEKARMHLKLSWVIRAEKRRVTGQAVAHHQRTKRVTSGGTIS